jgi:hypothetical protein
MIEALGLLGINHITFTNKVNPKINKIFRHSKCLYLSLRRHKPRIKGITYYPKVYSRRDIYAQTGIGPSPLSGSLIAGSCRLAPLSEKTHVLLHGGIT